MVLPLSNKCNGRSTYGALQCPDERTTAQRPFIIYEIE